MPTPKGSAPTADAPTVVTIGNFDGVHLGHQALLRAARARADQGPVRGRVVVATFSKHPAEVLRGVAHQPIATFEDRVRLLKEHGADEVVAIEPTTELLAMPPQEFLESFFAQHTPSAIVEGDDFRFGASRAGDIDTLLDFASANSVETIVVEQVDVGLNDQLIVRASSTITRWLLERGRVADAALVLGRPHRLTGTVVQGDRRGREIGFPTANIECGAMLPADGIYAGFATLGDGAVWPAAISIGTKPTFDGAHRALEAYLCGWDGPTGAEYGWTCSLDCVAWIRGQAKFTSIASLVEQIELDVDHTLRCLDTLHACPPISTTTQRITEPIS